jgi:galactose oxidase-like protein/glyoxal oxidase-like protein/Kelch motif protein
VNARFVPRLGPQFLLTPGARASLIAGALLWLLLPGPGLAQAPPTPLHPGHWTALQNWNLEAVHMALLPGSEGYHSRILWWHGSPDSRTYLEGGLWGWNWSAGADQCNSFGSFTSLPVNKAPFDIFCTSTTHLADGRLCLTGGTTSDGESGLRKAAYFDPTQPAATAWTETSNPMTFQRWYPSAQLMPRGEVIAYSGSSYHHMLEFAGTSVPGSYGSAQGDLRRYALTEASQWDAVIPFRPQPDWPAKRYGHSLVGRTLDETTVLFGGLGVDGNYRNDTWTPATQLRPLENDLFYYWEPRTTPLPRPLERAEHSAVVLNDGSMVIYGGRDGSQVFGDVWRQYNEGGWKWEELTQEPATPGGPLPGRRFGHGALYEYSAVAPVRDRALVYGGADTLAGSLADNDVWELTVDVVQHKAKWRKLALESGSPSPLPRYDHAMALDPERREREQNTPCLFRMFVSGGRGVFGAETLSDELWQLWDVDENTVAWSQLDAGPSRRAGHTLNYDPGRHSLVLMGGDTGGSASNEVWEMFAACNKDNYGGSCQVCAPPSYDPQWVNVTPAGSQALSGHTAFWGATAIYSRKPERLTPATGAGGTWETLSAPLLQEWYPYQFTIANGPNAGKVFNAGPSVASYLFDPASPSWSAAGGSGFRGGSAVLYRPDRVMKCGTRDTEQGATAVRTTKYIALDGVSPAWVASGDMDSGRVNHNLTMLPSGEVLVTGGTEIANNTGNQGRSRGLVELWRPPDATYYPNGIWYGGSGVNALEKSTAARDYHSVSLLLPDARVLCASGNVSPVAKQAQIYCPPYLFNADGTPATRPEITSAPTAITYGEPFVIGTPTPGTIASACLIRPGAVTHAYDQDQRFVPLALELSGSLRAIPPTSGRVAPPGDYLLFIVNQGGVPSVAKWVRLGQCPSIPCDTESPPKVTDLDTNTIGPNEVWLYWTAPGDDTSPPSGVYDVRASAAPIASEAQYAGAWQESGEPPVQPAGTPMEYVLPGGSSCTPFYVALKTRDGTGPSFKNWSLLSNTVMVEPVCEEGGGGFGAQRVDGERLAEGSSAAAPALSADANAGGAASVSGTGRPLADLAAGSLLDPGVGVLEAETHRTPQGGWQVTLRRLAQTEGVEAADAGAIVAQVANGAGGWRTLGRYRPTPGQSPLGLCALRHEGRMVFPSGYTLDKVVSGIKAGGQEMALSLADHSRLGSLGGEFVGAGGTVEMALGDALTLNYSPSTTKLASATSWYLLVRPAGGSESPATPARRVLATKVPTRFALYQNQPNPFRHTTTIAFDLPVACPVALEVFDLLGRKVATLAQGEHPAGAHAVEYDLRQADGAPLRAGVYVYRLRAGTFVERRKLTVLP